MVHFNATQKLFSFCEENIIYYLSKAGIVHRKLFVNHGIVLASLARRQIELIWWSVSQRFVHLFPGYIYMEVSQVLIFKPNV